MIATGEEGVEKEEVIGMVRVVWNVKTTWEKN